MNSYENTESPTTSKVSQTEKQQKLSDYFLTEEEIQKLRKEREEFSAYAAGKFKKIF